MEIVSELLGADHESLADLLRELQLELQQHELARSFKLLDLFWARLAVHIRAENLCLFPKLLNAPRKLFNERRGVPSFERVKRTIENLRADHNFFMDELSSAVKTIRTISSESESPQEVARQLDTISERVVALSERLIAHNVLEEDHVYTWPGLIFSSSEVERLAAEMKHEIENMPERFAGPY